MFVTHLESAIDGTVFDANRVWSMYANRPLWVRYDLPRIRRALTPADFIGREKSLWRYRELLFFLTWRDVKIRYKQAVLGVAWGVLQPALLMVVFAVFLGRLAKLSGGDIPYPLFVLAGLIAWTFFSTAST